MRPSGAHSHPDGGGGLVAIIAVVIIGAILAGPALDAVTELVHLVLIAVAVLAGLGVAGGVTALVLMRHRRAARAPYWATAGPRAARPVPARTVPRQLPAAPQIHVHLHSPVTAEDVAAIISRQQPAAWPALEENK
jgi:hypothetical protein